MPRANRSFVPGQVWHITHRCHRREFLLKFKRDRDSWLHWLFEARKRYGLCVLNYIVTSNHIHLLVRDTGNGAIAASMQLIAGQTAAQYNRRKRRNGAFWEGRYHATAVQTDGHLHRCIVYVDLNMVRAGVVRHPAEWQHCGYLEIQGPPQRYRVIDLDELARLVGVGDAHSLRLAHRSWVEQELALGKVARDPAWSESVAVGSAAYIEFIESACAQPGSTKTVPK